VAERMIEANGVELCTEPFGEPTDPPILLIMGTGASMLWWEEGLCWMLADRGRFVIRYDHRDTGRSATYEPGRPGYTGADLLADAAGVLDAYGVPAAHVVGVSAGGGFAQLLALDFADRVLSLVLISTSPATPGDRGLPPPTREFGRFVAAAAVNWLDRRHADHDHPTRACPYRDPQAPRPRRAASLRTRRWAHPRWSPPRRDR
jgi:pimeloyl-ACP methyl ester carboxylesterase